MFSILRVLSYGAVLFTLLAAFSGAALAQEVKDRELKPYFDFTTIQMPVEIVSIKVRGKELEPGQKIALDDDWLKGLSFTLKNISDKPIAYLAIGLSFPRPSGIVVYLLSYGEDYSRGAARRASSPRAIEPGETMALMLTKEKYPTFLNILEQGGVSTSAETVSYFIDRISFENEPDIIWQAGNLKRRDPNRPGKFNVIERYVLPKQQ